MVRVNHTSKISVGVAGYASSSHLRSAAERARARDDARSGQMVKSKLRSRFFHDDIRRCPTVSIPTSELMNGLPVRVREEVERLRLCCVPFFSGARDGGDGSSELEISNLYKHQLFSNDHAECLDPEIRQWLPRIVCPALPFSAWCRGSREKLGDEMLRHIETCDGFKAYFPGAHRKLFSGSSNPKPPLNEMYHLLKTTSGQLDFLKKQFGKEVEAGRHKLSNVSTESVEATLHSWRPIVKPGVEEVLPSDFPPACVPSFLGAIDYSLIEVEHSMFMNDRVEGLNMVPLNSSVVSESMEDAPESVYPELYLPPQLLHPTSDPAYVAAAVAAHRPRVEEPSPLVPEPFPSILEEITQNCFEEAAVPMNEYEWTLFSLGGDANSHAEGFHIQIHEKIAQNDEYFDWAFA